jgi:DNA-binding HxlR family transcriptional regulator
LEHHAPEQHLLSYSPALFTPRSGGPRQSRTSGIARITKETDMAIFETSAAVDIVYRSDGPSRPILDQIADKWSMIVMAVLDKPRRFNEIKRRIEGVTQRVLTQTLRRLERNGMIMRRVLPTSPVGVEYSLTALGESLREPFGQLYAWTVANTDQIRAHQMEYDRRMHNCRTRSSHVPAELEAPDVFRCPPTARISSPREPGQRTPLLSGALRPDPRQVDRPGEEPPSSIPPEPGSGV